MITGFNTDVKHNAKVYHVQTEDKGRNNPKIETLVYVGGEILDTCRTSYDQSKQELTEEEIMELLERQHKRVIRTIKIGKYDEISSMSEGLVSDRTLDEVILEYLASETTADQIKLVANGVSTLVRAGSSQLNIELKKVMGNLPVENAAIRVKLVSSNHPVQHLGDGVTNGNGHVTLSVSLPDISLPDGAILIQAFSEWGTAEQKFPMRR